MPVLHKFNHCTVLACPKPVLMTARVPKFMRWAALAAHLQQESARVLLSFCDWVEGEIDGFEEAGPLSAKNRTIRRLLKERAAQHERGAQLFSKVSFTAIFQMEDQTCRLNSQIWNS